MQRSTWCFVSCAPNGTLWGVEEITLAPGTPAKQTAEVTRTFLDQGVLGAVVIVLFFAVYKLWQKNNESQEKCVELAMQATKAVDAVTSSLDRNTDSLERLARDQDREESP